MAGNVLAGIGIQDGGDVWRKEFVHGDVREDRLGEIVVGEIVNFAMEDIPHVRWIGGALRRHVGGRGHQIAYAVLLDARQEHLRIPVDRVQGRRRVRLVVRARCVHRLPKADRVVCQEPNRRIGHQILAGDGERDGEQLIQILPGKLLHVRPGGESRHVAVLLRPEFRNVIDGATDADVEIIIALVLVDLVRIPSCVEVGAQQSPKLDDVEDDDGVQEKDQEDQDDLFSPRHPHVGALHATDISQDKGRDPEGKSPDEGDPSAAREGGGLRGDRFRLPNLGIERSVQIPVIVMPVLGIVTPGT